MWDLWSGDSHVALPAWRGREIPIARGILRLPNLIHSIDVAVRALTPLYNSRPPLRQVLVKAGYDYSVALLVLVVQGNGALDDIRAVTVFEVFGYIHIYVPKISGVPGLGILGIVGIRNEWHPGVLKLPPHTQGADCLCSSDRNGSYKYCHRHTDRRDRHSLFVPFSRRTCVGNNSFERYWVISDRFAVHQAQD